MGLKVGIVGLPNIGKSTLFNAITNSNVEAANYPFATIEPNIGVVEVPDKRLNILVETFGSKKKIGATIDFVDIAGLIAKASEGEGLGNAFLSNVRETDLICMVVRCFENKDIIHVEGSIDVERDVETIELELILSDESVVDKRIAKIAPKIKAGNDKEIIKENDLLQKIKKQLSECKLINKLNFDEEEAKMLKSFNLITAKKFIFCGNVDESQIVNESNHFKKLKELADKKNVPVIKVCAKVEEELSKLNDEDRLIFSEEYNIKKSGLETLIETAFKTLDLWTFYTAGPMEAHAWPFQKGSLAPQCAGIIHTDFEKGFIKAEVYNVEDLKEYNSELLLKNAGKIRLEGKGYKVNDGDVCFFKFNN